MLRECSIPDCPNTSNTGHKLYGPPPTPENREPWIKYLREHGIAPAIPKTINVCQDHFVLSELKDGSKHRYYNYPTVPKNQWCKDKANEETSRPTYIVKVDMDALNSGDIRNLIQSIKRGNSSSDPLKISKIETPQQPRDEQSSVKPIQSKVFNHKNLSTPKAFSVPPVRLKLNESRTVIGNFKVASVNGTPKVPEVAKPVPKISKVTSFLTLNKVTPRTIIPRKIEPRIIPSTSKKSPIISKGILASSKAFPGLFKATPVSFKSVTFGPKYIKIPKPQEVDPLNIKQEPEATTSESNFRIEAVHENFQEAMEMDLQMGDQPTEVVIAKPSDGARLNYYCTQCPMLFSNKHQLKAHKEKGHKEISKVIAFGCSICSKKFLDKKSVIEHEKAHDQLERSRKTCKICSKEFWTLLEFLAHVKRDHSVSFDHLTYLCIECMRSFDNIELLAVHKRAQHSLCPHCNKHFKSLLEISRHITQTHSKNKNLSTFFQCPKCQYTTNSKVILERHKMLHQNSLKNFHCAQCKKTLKSQEDFSRHMAEHDETMEES